MEKSKNFISHKKGGDESSPWYYLLVNENDPGEVKCKNCATTNLTKPIYIRCEG